ncbi:MAG TPA: PhoH family protein [Myxococcota bacterium]|nr:PhoH family protein [Myxococcota bacterium]
MADEDPLVLEDNALAQVVYGQSDRNLRKLEQLIGVRISARGNRVRVSGPILESKLARRVIRDLYDLALAGAPVEESDVRQMVHLAEEPDSHAATALVTGGAVEVGRRKRILPRTENQRVYLETIREHALTFGIGPAGTGKTYLAMAMAVQSLLRREVGRIILTRPAVEAGEKLGFLPGTLFEKVDPYLRPLTDALHDMMHGEEVSRRMERGIIEVAPLAFMRGRTLNDAFIILDEAQNTTSEQMRMFLTRMGFDSKVVINGDVTQTDLPRGTVSGLIEAKKVLAEVPGIAFVQFTEKDVVRHPLVQEVIRAYDRYEGER